MRLWSCFPKQVLETWNQRRDYRCTTTMQNSEFYQMSFPFANAVDNDSSSSSSSSSSLLSWAMIFIRVRCCNKVCFFFFFLLFIGFVLTFVVFSLVTSAEKGSASQGVLDPSQGLPWLSDTRNLHLTLCDVICRGKAPSKRQKWYCGQATSSEE